MNAITKNWISEEMISQMVSRACKEPNPLKRIKALSGGFCSAVYLVETEQKMVLKVASDAQVKVMRHEREYVPTEAQMLRTLHEKTTIPMPELIYYDDSAEICDVPYFFMSFLEGKPLSECGDVNEEQRECIKGQMGDITKQICTLEAPVYGIPNIEESYCRRNSEFVYLLFDWLLLDAEEKQVEIPGITPKQLRELIKSCAEELDSAATPRYIHTDTWDGNIMVRDGKMTGLVDYAAVLYGDPLMSHDFHDFGDNPTPAFLKGYGKESFSREEKCRILVYRIWQRLGMVVERGYRGYEDTHMYEWVLGEFTKEVNRLRIDRS